MLIGGMLLGALPALGDHAPASDVCAGPKFPGTFIGQPTADASDKEDLASPWFRKTLVLDQKPVQAVAWVVAMGYYELYIDGKKIDDHVLSPAVSDYAKRAYYLEHDVLEALGTGEHCIGLWLGRGWYFQSYPGVVHPGPIVNLELRLTYADGSQETITTDASWKYHPSYLTTTARKGFAHDSGERYDANLEMPDWCMVSRSDAAWENAVVVAPPTEVICAQHCPPNRIQEVITPVSVKAYDEKSWLVDMGTVLCGYLDAKLPVSKGRTVFLEFIERFEPNGEPVTYGQVDRYIPAAEGLGHFRNRFNYSSFRYVRIRGLREAPKREDIQGLFIHTDFDDVGAFQCSNELLNKIYDTVKWTYRCVALGGYLVDCPHRERLGYGGDGTVTMETGLYNFNTKTLYEKWLGNWRDAQDPETGFLPNTAPYPHSAGGGPTWGAICILLPWQHYLHYGDAAILQENYPMMEAYIRFLDSKSEGDLLRPYGSKEYGFLGDWVAPDKDQGNGRPWSDERSRTFFNNCFYRLCCQQIAKIANVLGESEKATYYLEKAEKIKAAANKEFFEADKNSYVCGEQPYFAFPLLTGTVPEGHEEAVLANLVHAITVTNKNHVNTGMHGTYFTFDYLNRIGRDDLIFNMVNQTTYPSWGYMLEKGATTIWERWDGERSGIHSTLLAVGSWFSAGLLGIKPDPEAPGFAKVIIDPRVVGDLSWAKGHYDSIQGRIVSQWKKEGGELLLHIEIPQGLRGRVFLPDANTATLKAALEGVAGVDAVEAAKGKTVVAVQGGVYDFKCACVE